MVTANHAEGREFFGSRHQDAGLSGVIGIVGISGTGKTYRAQRLLQKAKRSVYFDTPGNVGHRARQNPMPGWFEIWSYADFVQFMRFNRHKSFRVVYHPGEDAEKDFHAISKLVFAIGNVVFFVDEIWEFCREGGWMPLPLRRIVFRGRHAGITLMWTAQQPQLVTPGLRSQTSSYYVFRMTQRRSLDAMRDSLPDGAIEVLGKLPDRHYVYRDERQNWKIVTC